MGTAGHVDHGKTSLVKALTGVDCDRLAEEKRRGITIELGFAQCCLPGGLQVGVVDVPGHERFVKNMVAGAAGMDFVLLVIAADEGIMPQTREHLEICALLGLKHGVVALTKIDTVDAEWAEMAEAEIRSWLAGGFLENAPVIPVSSTSGQGIDRLRDELAKLAQSIAPHRRTDLFRLPVDRVFTMKGHGTVVTGTVVSGQICVGDDLAIYPKGTTTKARGVQSHGSRVDCGHAGSRAAVNVQGLDVGDIARGGVLAHPGALFPSKRWDVLLSCLAGSPRALRSRTELRIHHMASDVLGRFYFSDRDKLEPGQSCLAELRFSEPMTCVANDAFVVRAFSPLRTVGGGIVVHPLAYGLHRKSPDFGERINQLASLARMGDEEKILTLLSLAGGKGLCFAELRVFADIESKQLEKTLQQLGAKGKAVCFDRDERAYVHERALQCLSEACLASAADLHKKEPLKPGFARAALASGWSRNCPAKLVHAVFERLLKSGRLVSEGETLRLAEHRVTLAADQDALRTALLKIYADAGFSPPNVGEVLEGLKVGDRQAAPVLQMLQAGRELVKVSEALYFAPQSVDALKAALLAWFREHETLDLAEFKAVTNGLSRKYLVPLLEYFDRERLTMRVGDKRRLRGKQG
jgi:selenocysteine-specific elongation factor